MSEWTGTTVLVTGGAGAIGSQLVRRLHGDGAAVVVVDDLSSGHLDALPTGLHDLVIGDITDVGALDRAFRSSPEVVFHLAALFANQNSIDHPERDLAVNGLGTLRVVDAARRRGVRRIVYASSSCVYGDRPGALREDHASIDAATPYQATKLLGEQYARLLSGTGVEPVVARLFNVYGPGDGPGRYRSVIPNFLAAALCDEPITVHGDGSATRDFTYVDDIVDGLLRCATVPEAAGGTFNLGAGSETTVAQLASSIVRITGSRSEIRSVPGRPWDTVRRRRADPSRAADVLGWSAVCGLEPGLRATAAWLRDGVVGAQSRAAS